MSKKPIENTTPAPFFLLKLPYELIDENLPEVLPMTSKEEAQAYIKHYREQLKLIKKTVVQESAGPQHYFIFVQGSVVLTTDWSPDPTYVLHL